LVLQLANDKNAWVRAGVAQRRGLPLDIRWQLARDPHEFVRAAVATVRTCPRRVILELLQDRSVVVRSRLVSRDDVSVSDLLELALNAAAEPGGYLDDLLAQRLVENINEVAEVATRAQVRDLLRTDGFRQVGQKIAVARKRKCHD
jgi:hypothetical protein